MSDVWIIGAPSELVAAVERSLAGLGLHPRVTTPHERLVHSGGSDRGAGAETQRLPTLLVVVDEVDRVAERVAADDELSKLPMIVIADEQRLATGAYAAVGHELVIHPFSSGELETRIARARYAALGPDAADIVISGTLELNTATYQVRVAGHPIDFTYMEYELLKFLVTHPARVFSREALLSNVWGYDYYGGARTVDVHIRRLRAKLGPEHAERIRTLRSVGYRWDGDAG